MNAICKVIIKNMFQSIFELWFHEILHICSIYFLNPVLLAKQEMFYHVSCLVLVQKLFCWGVIIFHPI